MHLIWTNCVDQMVWKSHMGHMGGMRQKKKKWYTKNSVCKVNEKEMETKELEKRRQQMGNKDILAK